MAYRFRKLTGLLSFLILILYSSLCLAWSEKSETAVIQPNVIFSLPDDPQISTFRFPAGKVFLLSTGEWKVEGWLRHEGILCGTYEIGMQFGQGSRGCMDVKWLTEPHFVTSRKQCNNSNLEHKGFAEDPVLVKKYSDISCARRIVRCTGTCKLGSGMITDDP